jgi:uncharacterized protein DUF3223
MAKPVQIGRFAFATQKEAREFIRAILSTSTWGEPLVGETLEFVLSLLDRHPRASEKIGSGIKHVTVDKDGSGDRCFHIQRIDGEKYHFSYQKALAGKDNIRSMVLGALNRAVDEQIWAFRDSELAKGPQTCPYTREAITKDNYHVDHPDPTFFELQTKWFEETGLTPADIKISDGSENEIGRQMTDLEQKESWRAFHLANARLRLLSPLGNLSGAKIEANRRMRAK